MTRSATPDDQLASIDRLAFQTASEHVSTRVPTAEPFAKVGDVRQSLANGSFDLASHIAVCEHGKLVGLLRIEDLFAAPADVPVYQLMDADPPSVAPGTDQEIVAWRAVQREESALPVVDSEGYFKGMIPPHRLLAILLWEHEEDMTRLGGVLKETSAARSASLETVARRFWHRLPWLLLGLAGAFFAADIVSFFEAQLQEKVILAFFIPGLVYLADAVGTQTETLVVRGLSVGVPLRQMVLRETFTGLLMGVSLAALLFPITLWRWDDPAVALTVSLALMAACSIATVVAMALPWAFQRLDRDPAFGSGPLATVIQDLLTITLYFALATVVIS